MSAVVESVQMPQQKVSLLESFAAKYQIEPKRMLDTLRGTAFKDPKDGPPITNEQLIALVIVANQYGLNPLTKEIYAFPDKRNGIIPVVGVDGWSRIINQHPMFDGAEFVDGPVDAKGIPEWIECVLYRKDRSHPTRVREYFAECRRGTDPWNSHPRRMLRHKSWIQCGRLAFGFVGIYDQDEAERIVEGGISEVRTNEALADINQRIERRAAAPDLLPASEPARDIDAEQSAGLDAASAPVEKSEVDPPKAGSGKPTVTYAWLMDRINKAADPDLLDADASLIEELPALDQKKELVAAYKARRAALLGE